MDATSAEGSTAEFQPTVLYRHTKRPDWGVAMIAWEQGDRRGYQFEDGTLRIFKKGYYGLLEEAYLPVEEASRIAASLHRQIGVSSNAGGSRSSTTAHIEFRDQLHSFSMQYPGGFEDPTWLANVRGEGAKRRLKRHRDAAIEEAQSLLGANELDEMIDGEKYDAVVAAVRKVLEGTDLATASHLKSLDALAPARYETFARALREVLHNAENYASSFDAMVSSLTVPSRGKPVWQLATALSALVLPAEHICIRPTNFSAQAEIMATSMELGRTPHGIRYLRLRDMAVSVAGHLRASSLEPRDLMDIYDFMWVTLRPAARKLLSAARSKAQKEAAARSSEAAAKRAAEDEAAKAAAAAGEQADATPAAEGAAVEGSATSSDESTETPASADSPAAADTSSAPSDTSE